MKEKQVLLCCTVMCPFTKDILFQYTQGLPLTEFFVLIKYIFHLILKHYAIVPLHTRGLEG